MRHLAVQEAVVVVLANLQEGEFYDASRTVGSVANEGRVEYREVQRPQRRQRGESSRYENPEGGDRLEVQKPQG